MDVWTSKCQDQRQFEWFLGERDEGEDEARRLKLGSLIGDRGDSAGVRYWREKCPGNRGRSEEREADRVLGPRIIAWNWGSSLAGITAIENFGRYFNVDRRADDGDPRAVNAGGDNVSSDKGLA